MSGAEGILNALRRLTEFAAREGIQIVSTADAHTENDPEFKFWKPHCIVATAGQQKATATLTNGHVTLATAPGALDGLREKVHHAAQIVVEKQQLDCFTNPHLRPLFDLLAPERYVVYGVVTEHCVRCAAFGLLETRARVELVTDAVQSLDARAADDLIRRFELKGGTLTTVVQVTA